MVVEALRTVGAARSIVIDEAGVILAGNGVQAAAAEAGITKLQIVDVDGRTIVAVRRRDLTPAQKRELAIYDNRTAELGVWNVEQLHADLSAGLVLEPWFSGEELADLVKAAPVKLGRTDPDAIPPARATSIVRGDVFALGRHRILCGDATQAAELERLLAGTLAGLVYTDPPYGLDYAGGTLPRRKLAGDDTANLYAPACQMAATWSDEAAPFYLWHGVGRELDVAAALALRAAGYEIRNHLVWNKNHAQFGALSAQYKQKHEAAYYAFKRGQAPRWFGPANEVTVWDCDRPPANEFHPTQKPVALAVRAIHNSADPMRPVLDLFLGSGSTLIACEQTGRAGLGVELEPAYCQVAIDRWEAFTGQKAEKVAAL